MSAATEPSTLLGKLLEAQRAAGAVGKQGRNEDQGYDYARAEDVIAEAQRALHEAGLVGYMRPGEVESTGVQSRSGTAGLFVTLHAVLVIADPESGEVLEIAAHGTGTDYPGDKAVYKALTGAAKYAYASALGIPFGDDPEDSTSTSPEARETSQRGGVEATPAQKRALTVALNKVGMSREMQAWLVHTLAGDPPAKAGISRMLDQVVEPSKAGDDERLRAAVDALVGLAEAEAPPPSDVPADTEGLDEAPSGPADDEAEPTPFEVGPGEPTLLEDRPDTETA